MHLDELPVERKYNPTLTRMLWFLQMLLTWSQYSVSTVTVTFFLFGQFIWSIGEHAGGIPKFSFNHIRVKCQY